jgi:hypothetical protein
MTVHIEELVSEVTVEDDAPADRRQPAALWEQLAILRRLLERDLLDAARTSAFGSED